MLNFYIFIGPKGLGKNNLINFLKENIKLNPISQEKLDIDNFDVAIIDVEDVAKIKRNYVGDKQVKVCGIFVSDQEYLKRINKESMDKETGAELKRFWGADLICDVYLNVDNYPGEELHQRILKWIQWEEEYAKQ